MSVVTWQRGSTPFAAVRSPKGACVYRGRSSFHCSDTSLTSPEMVCDPRDSANHTENTACLTFCLA